MAGEAILRALKHVWMALSSVKIPAAVADGIAMSAWKHVRATKDIDLLTAVGSEDVDPLLQRLAESRILPQSDPPSVSLGQLDVIRLLYEHAEAFLEIEVDLLIARSQYYEQALQRRVATQLPDLDIEIAVLTCEDVILHKLLAGRIIDRADAAALLRANRETLDFHHLLRWIRDLELNAEFTETWSDAIPGESIPVE